jgi:hypothetical protein
MKLLSSLLILLYGLLNSCSPEKSEAKSFELPSDSALLYIPKELTFAGERVPLDSFDVLERLERELIVNKYKHSSTFLILKRSSRYRERIQKILREEGVPEDFLYLAAIESEFDPYANSGYAAGWWQFTPSSAEENNLEISEYVEQRYDLAASTIAACKALKKAKERLGSWTMAAAAYNRGTNAILNISSQQHVSSFYSLYLNTETSRYVFRILAMKLLMEFPEKYGYYLKEEEKYKPLVFTTLKVDQTIEDLSTFAIEKGINFKILKFYNPWINFNPVEENSASPKTNKSSGKKAYKKSYRFEVPTGKSYIFELPVSR